MPWVLPSTGPGRQPEGFVLDPDGLYGVPVDLGNLTGLLRLASLTIPPAQKLPTWASNGDSDGQQLVRTPFYANRECTMQVRVNATDADTAMSALGTLEDKLQEADRNEGGLPVLWTPTGATTGLTLYILLAQITDMPVTVDDGWFAHKPVVTVAFSCRPFLYGEETSVALVSSSSPIVTITVPNVAGDVPAEARLVLTDGSSQARRFVEWGLEQRYYDVGSPSSLLIDSPNLVTTGFAGAGTANSGALGGTAIASTLFAQPVAVCGTGDQPHVGSFRVKARIQAASLNEYWRLSWQNGDGPFSTNNLAVPVVTGNFSEVDLGIVTVEPAASGTQKWSGRVEAFTTTAGGETGQIDYLLMFPVDEGFSQLSATYDYQPGAIIIHDEFTGTAAGTALNGRAAPAGGTWATSGATTDFAFADAPGTSETVSRATSSGSDAGAYRFAIIGGTITDSEVGVQTYLRPGIAVIDAVLIARWVDSSNYLRLQLQPFLGFGTGGGLQLILDQVVAGVVTTLATGAVHTTTIANVWFTTRLIVFASGNVIGTLMTATGSLISQVGHLASAAKTGGSLQAGKVGFADQATAGTPTRYYDNFYAAIPAPENVTINSGKTLEIRSDSNLRQSVAGTAYGDIASRGSRLFIPPAGDAGRTTRIVARATRNDLTTTADTSVADGDSLSARVYWTPRYLAVPR